MGKIGYVFQRIMDMNYSQFFEYVDLAAKNSKKPKIVMLFDIIRCGFQYQAGYVDYVLFEFYRLTPQERATYITRGVNDRYIKAFNPRNFWNLIEDKTAFNKRFSKYIHRRWCDISDCDYEDYIAFITAGDFDIAAKPIDGTCGHGIDIISRENIGDLKTFYERCKSKGQFLLEERIIQCDEMMGLYSGSVNTTRLVTMLAGGEVHVMFACIRIGNNNHVDNLNSGGMSALVDPKTGIITHSASDKESKIYEVHPQSGTRIKGFQIPRYDEALELVKSAALTMPELGYVGWDIAIAKDGPLMVEANHYPGHDIYQLKSNMDTNIGLKPHFDEVYHKKLNENI